MIAVVFAVILSAGLALIRTLPPKRMPIITVKSGDTQIDCTVFQVNWYGAVNNCGGLSEYLKNVDIDKLPWLKDGDDVEIQFNGIIPKSYKLFEHIKDKDGFREYDINFDPTDRSGSFIIQPGNANNTSTSGQVIKGYRLDCVWARSNNCELVFIVRGDAAATPVPEVN